MGRTNIILGEDRLAWLREEVKRREKGSVSELLRDVIDRMRQEAAKDDKPPS